MGMMALPPPGMESQGSTATLLHIREEGWEQGETSQPWQGSPCLGPASLRGQGGTRNAVKLKTHWELQRDNLGGGPLGGRAHMV